MKPLDLHALSWNDFVANAAFFVIDVVLLSIFVPFFVRRYETRKWKPARVRLAERSLHYMDRIDFHFDLLASNIEGFRRVFSDLLKDRSDLTTGDGIRKQRSLLLRKFNDDLDSVKAGLEETTSEYLQSLEMLIPSFNSRLSINTMEFYESSVRPRSIAMGILYTWSLVAEKNEPPDLKMGHELGLDELYTACEKRLEELCRSASLKTNRVDGRLRVTRKEAGRSKLSLRNIYPNHPTILSSVERLHMVLTGPLVSSESPSALQNLVEFRAAPE